MRTESHNTLLIDGGNQDPKAEAPVVAFRSEPRLAFVRVNLAPAYPGRLKRFERGVALAERSQVFVQDELTTDQPVEALWGMVTGAEVELKGRQAILRQGDWNLEAAIVAPEEAAFGVVSTTPLPPQNPNSGTRKLVVKLPGKVTNLRLVVRLKPWGPGTRAPELSWTDRPLAEW